MNEKNRITAVAALATLLIAGLAGCLGEQTPSVESYADLGFDGENWPRLDGTTLTILDHGAFAAFDQAKEAFEALTGATVVHVSEEDTGGVLERARLEADQPTFDVVYGIDNILLRQALDDDLFQEYRPLLADRIDPDLVFFTGPWYATPVDHGYIGLNIDTKHPALDNVSIASLYDVRVNADLFVTQDPRFSTPGLGFLLATIARFGEFDDYDWRDYWRDLLAGGALVTQDWSTAYEIHFSGGYGIWEAGHLGDRPIVTSYTESPAYEWYWDEVYPRQTGEWEPGGHYSSDPANLPRVLLDDESVFHQIQTMAIARGTPNLAAAQAWIEFTLTDAFQELAAPGNAVYPVVPSIDVSGTYGGMDPIPTSRQLANLDYEEIGHKLERWVLEWTALCESYQCA